MNDLQLEQYISAHNRQAELIDKLKQELDAALTLAEIATKARDDIKKELEEYRSIAEKVGAVKAVSEKEQYKDILYQILREFPVGNINQHTIESLPERISYYLKELSEYTQRVEDLECELEELRMLYDESSNPQHKDGR
jgi:predicted RNase H-like nuclease (RuvC/YqgF family)